MAFKATNVELGTAYKQVKISAKNLKANLQVIRAYSETNNIGYQYIFNVVRLLIKVNAAFDELKTTPGLLQYAKDQENDQAYNVGSEFTAMQQAIADTLTWFDTNVPVNVTLSNPSNWTSDDMPISNTFTPQQTAGMRTQMDVVITAIE